MQGFKTDRLLSICVAARATHYLSGPAAASYLEIDKFTAAGITVSYADYSGYPVYPQLHEPFEHGVSDSRSTLQHGDRRTNLYDERARMTQTILGDVAQYYGDKLRQHGATPAGVDWKDESSQILRFEQLLRVVTDPRGSVIDFGCGFGALLGNMRGKGFVGDYLGIDIASDMIETAASKYATDRKARFETGSSPSTQADYAVASGIFNVSMHHDKDAWKDYVAATLAEMNASSKFGFAFNCLTTILTQTKCEAIYIMGILVSGSILQKDLFTAGRFAA